MPAMFAVVAAAAALTACQQPVDDAIFGQKVRNYLLTHPEILREVAQKLSEKDQADARTAAAAALAKNRDALERDPRDFVVNPAGSVTVVEFFDYRCSFCKLAAPEVLKLVAENPDIRFVFKELPIFGEVSDSAARLALTPAVKAKGLQVYKLWMEDKALSEAGLDRSMAAAGIDVAAARADAAAPAVAKQIEDVRGLARALKIEGTPAFVVGDTLVPGADMAALRTAIAAARAKAAKRPS